MKHALFFILLALSMSCVKTVEKPLYARSVGMEDSRGTGASFSLSYWHPNQFRDSIVSGSKLLLFNDSLFVTGGDSVYLYGWFLPVVSVIPQDITFRNVQFLLNGDTIPSIVSSNNGYISVTPNIPVLLIHHVKVLLNGKAYGPSGIQYYLRVDAFDIRKGKNGNGALLPVENVGFIHCSPTQFL